MTTSIPTVREPSSAAELGAELRRLHEESTAFWSRFTPAEFFVPLGEAWSPADNVRHLVKSCRPVARALGLPKLMLVIPGRGISLRRSRSYAEMRDTYRARLATGEVQAGRFAPRPEPLTGDPEVARESLMATRQAVAERLHAAVAGWGERSLDRFRLPHPALGQLTVREMLFFTLYHNLHHVLNVAARKGWRDGAER
ncbi:MAG TPA: DinB family protein [Kofleriaceae bacterium]|jgi:hypothetical protein